MPHTKQQIQYFLGELGTNPHHKWGQNFLIDLNLMQLVVDSIDIRKDDLVLEVGHGTGSLTELLSDNTGHVIAVDIDPNMHLIASRELKARENVSFIHTDILAKKSVVDRGVMELVSSYKAKLSGRLLLVANLPYNVASPLIINLLTEVPPLEGMCVTVQEEVADRMAASSDNTSAYGKLSIILQACGVVEKVRTIKPGAFWPPPKINSAIVSWHTNNTMSAVEIESLKSCADMLLGKRRKQLQSCLPKGEIKQMLVSIIEGLGIDPTIRAEKLTVEQFVEVARVMETVIGQLAK